VGGQAREDDDVAIIGWQRQGLAHVEADEAVHFGQQWAEVVGFFAADVGELVQEDVEVVFPLVVRRRSVACGASEDVGEAAGDVVEFLFLVLAVSMCWLTSLKKRESNGREKVGNIPFLCRESPRPRMLRWW
jgi:hypothetical protein